MPARPLITLLTDFGTDDTYVGQVKGVLAARCPDAIVIDLTHAVRPHAIAQGAFLLESALEPFPSGTIHLAVVDPGVGTARSALAIRSRVGGGERLFAGPDNGLLSCALPLGRRPETPGAVSIPEGVAAVTLDMPPAAVVAATFHGRDLFAHAAARLANGVALERLGRPAATMQALPPFRAYAGESRSLVGTVIHIDRFGNVITTVHVSQLRGAPRAVTLAGEHVTRWVHTYGDGEGLVALIGSSGFLEVAEVNGSAAARLAVEIGAAVQVEQP